MKSLTQFGFFLWLVSLFSQDVLAGQKPIPPLGDTSVATRVIDEIDGVYKRRILNRTMDGDQYESEDILEIVRMSKNSIYFKTSLEFDNGHQCNLHGLATYRNNHRFLFIDTEVDEQKRTCLLTITPTKTGLELAELNEACRAYCGVRGTFNGIRFNKSLRIPFPPLPPLKQSHDQKN